MNHLRTRYRTSLALLTDLYQLTMAYGYWKNGQTGKQGVFHAYFRKNPFEGGFTVAAGLEDLIYYLQDLRFEADDLQYLGGLKGNDGKPLFEQGFLDYLGGLHFDCDLHAVPEGTLVFPNEPLLRVSGDMVMCQLIESALLNIVNFQSLIATKTARLRLAAKDDLLLEFGLRRAQGIDGSLSVCRASYIAGCDATSNVLAGKLYGIPVRGTHAHSWVMSFESEAEAFSAYAQAMPNNCVFLVDTYDTLEGVKEAIEVGRTLRAQGYELAGIRLDSGDLAYLSVKARELLDAAGFPKAAIVASNDLDEHLISSLKNEQGAAINIWGVGTRLASSYDQPALGGVYKLAAAKEADESTWQYKLKLSEQTAKTSTPGIQQIRRFYYEDGKNMADMVFNELEPPVGKLKIIDPNDNFRSKRIDPSTPCRDLLQPVFEKGKLVYDIPTLEQVRAYHKQEMGRLDRSMLRFANPHIYPVGLESGLYQLKGALIKQLKREE